MKKCTKTTLVALLSHIKIKIIGQLYGSEFIAIFLFPYLHLSSILRKNLMLRNIGYAYLLLLLSLMVSDVINNTTFHNYSRGWSNIFFSFFMVVFFYHQLKYSNKIIIYYLIFSAISFFIFRPEYDIIELGSNSYKVIYMLGVNYLLLAVLYFLYKKHKIIACILLLIYAIFSLMIDARSNGVIFLLSAFFLLFKNNKMKLSKTAILCILVFFYISYILYAKAVLSGEISGSNASQLNTIENPYNPLQLLFAGRNEIFIAINAISQKPIFGYGSWAEDKTGDIAKLRYFLNEYKGDSTMIPVHSIIFTVWLWAGIGGFVAIMSIFILIFRMIIHIYNKSDSQILIILIPLSINLLWDFLFSPIGHLRQSIPIIFALIITEYYNLTKKQVI